MAAPTLTPTPQLRWVLRDHTQQVLQQRHQVAYDAGTAKESTRYVWVDVPAVLEPKHDEAARKELETLMTVRTK